MLLHSHIVRAIILPLLLGASGAAAVDINVVGLTTGKAVVSIEGGKPRTLSVGQVTPEGVKLISASSESAVFEVNGERRTLAVGEGAAVASAAPARGGTSVTLIADSRGHFTTIGVVNGVSLQFLVDTGATAVVLSSADARRAGVNYLAGARALTQTANGVVPVYAVKLDSLRVGDITLSNVDASVIEGDKLPVALLGMSFLNRMEMRREGTTLTLIRRY
ncbi:MAG TPA: TIGR02281 family clan AA aspartic protease [Burkholderiales bacterium]|nr:TIGR02281 family clan AA aspartic protease [Burkholderiales bacterium]